MPPQTHVHEISREAVVHRTWRTNVLVDRTGARMARCNPMGMPTGLPLLLPVTMVSPSDNHAREAVPPAATSPYGPATSGHAR